MLALITTLTSLALGTVVAVMRMSKFRVLRGIGRLYVEIFRNIPGLFWLLFFYFAFPEILPFGWGDKLNACTHYAFIAAVLGLTFDNTSYVSDIIRGGIISIPKGQKEAAVSTGLNVLQQWVYVILPMAFRNILPPLGTRMIHNLKNTSLAMVIAVQELTWTTQQIESITFRGVEATTIATIFYICLSMTLAAIIIRLEKYLVIEIESIKQVGN
jgi:polar amino acid transport system permease protein